MGPRPPSYPSQCPGDPRQPPTSGSTEHRHGALYLPVRDGSGLAGDSRTGEGYRLTRWLYCNSLCKIGTSYFPTPMFLTRLSLREGEDDADTLAKAQLAASDATTAPQRGPLAPPDSRVARCLAGSRRRLSSSEQRRGLRCSRACRRVCESPAARGREASARRSPATDGARTAPLSPSRDPGQGRAAGPPGRDLAAFLPYIPATPHKTCTAHPGCCLRRHPCCLAFLSASNHATGDI